MPYYINLSFLMRFYFFFFWEGTAHGRIWPLNANFCLWCKLCCSWFMRYKNVRKDEYRCNLCISLGFSNLQRRLCPVMTSIYHGRSISSFLSRDALQSLSRVTRCGSYNGGNRPISYNYLIKCVSYNTSFDASHRKQDFFYLN